MTLWNLYHENSTRIDFNTIDQICHTFGIQVGDLLEYVETKEKKVKEPKSKKGR
jgi:DNA-binding Xre family transcriptional regulator